MKEREREKELEKIERTLKVEGIPLYFQFRYLGESNLRGSAPLWPTG